MWTRCVVLGVLVGCGAAVNTPRIENPDREIVLTAERLAAHVDDVHIDGRQALLGKRIWRPSMPTNPHPENVYPRLEREIRFRFRSTLRTSTFNT